MGCCTSIATYESSLVTGILGNYCKASNSQRSRKRIHSINASIEVAHVARSLATDVNIRVHGEHIP